MPSKQDRYIMNNLTTRIESDMRTVFITLKTDPTAEQMQRFKNQFRGRGAIDGRHIELTARPDNGKLATTWEALTTILGHTPQMGDV